MLIYLENDSTLLDAVSIQPFPMMDGSRTFIQLKDTAGDKFVAESQPMSLPEVELVMNEIALAVSLAGNGGRIARINLDKLINKARLHLGKDGA